MKKFNLFAAAVAVSVMGGAAVSCNKPETPSPEPQPQPVEKNLPELQDVSVDPGKSKEITFYAYGAWTVEVDKTWCTPDKTSGEKGDNKVVFSVADAFEAAETAKVTLTIGEDKDVVTFNITRNAKEREFAVTSSTDGSAVAELVFGEDAKSVEIKVKANFWWQLDAADDCNAQWPLWLSKPSPRFEGKASDIVTVTLTVDEEQLPNFYDSKEGVIWFNDVENPDVKYSINVKHTFEKPVFLASDRGTSLKVSKDLCFYGADGNVSTDKSVSFKLTPEDGKVGYTPFLYYYKYMLGSTDPKFGWVASQNGVQPLPTKNSASWMTFDKGESEREWTLNINAGLEPLHSGSGPFAYVTTKVYIFIVPNDVYLTQQPDMSGLQIMQSKFFSNNNTPVIVEGMEEYMIEVEVEN